MHRLDSVFVLLGILVERSSLFVESFVPSTKAGSARSSRRPSFAIDGGRDDRNGEDVLVSTNVLSFSSLLDLNGSTVPSKRQNGSSRTVSRNGNDERPSEVEFVADTSLPTALGQFRMRGYRVTPAHPVLEPCVIYAEPPAGHARSLPVRIHDQCLTSEVFGSLRCDCSEQLLMAMRYIKEHGGLLIYLQQEGRGIGLANKIAAYALQDQGFDTVDANVHLGFPEDCREYNVVKSILSDLKVDSIRLMTNNPRKVRKLAQLGIQVDGTIPMVVNETTEHNQKYLETKERRMQHDNLSDLLTRRDDATRRLNAGMIPLEELTTEGMEGVTAASDGYCFGRQSVEDAIAAIGRGEMVAVVDDMNRENEADFIMAADLCTPNDMARIVKYSSGVVCVALEEDRLDQLDLPPMVAHNQDPKGTAFTVSVDATEEHGISTGISAADRATTIQLLASANSLASDFHRPGHIFPLRARTGGVLTRDGHTEAAVDLARLAGRAPAGVLCEICSEQNPTEMMRVPEMLTFCQRHGLQVTSITDLIQYRRDTGL